MNGRLLAVVSSCVAISVGVAGAGELQVGAASAKITPPLGVPMAGYYSERLAEGVHDDLWAKAIVIEKDGVKAALVALDLISTKREIVEAARDEIHKQTGIPGAHVMISATHAHTGPILSGGSKRIDALGGKRPVAEQYTADLPGRIVEAIKAAHGRIAAAKTSAALGREEHLSFNRRFHMKDGTVGWNPGKLNPNILRPVAPIDPEVPLVYWESASGKPLAAYVNFAMHLDTVGGLQLSADYPYTLARLLSEFKGPEMLAVFTVGTCGDVNHVNVHWANPQKGHGEAARIGTILAAEALKTFERLQPVEATRLAVRTEIVPLALPKIQPGEVEKARQIAARHSAKQGKQPSFLETVNAYKVLDVQARQGKPLEAEVQVIALGRDLAWVGLPGEVFVELGMAIKAASPFERTIVVELANGSIGYVPTKRAYAEGNYEAVSARCAEGSGELLVDASLRLLRQLYAEALPKKADGDNAK